METLTGAQKKTAISFLKQAANIAKKSTCQRARCGSVIVQNDKIVGRGFNSPPANKEENRKCHIKEELPADFNSDKTGCIHAEQRAVMNALRSHNDLSGSRLYFIRIDEGGEITKAGQPYCTICSKMVLDAGVEEFVLWHEDGVTVYDTTEYNNLSFQRT